MLETLREFYKSFPFLFWCTVLTGLLLVPTLGLMAFDTRLLVGANPWLKPVKFELSILLFNLTIGWLLLRTAPPSGAAQTISWVVASVMFVEIAAILIQAARGVPSHYNVSTGFDAAVFGSMAVAIVLNTLVIGWFCLLSFQAQPQLPAAVAWGIRLGLVLFLLSSFQGFLMIRINGHTVGASDGGPGLPILLWSTVVGDLRVAHFIGIHGIQVLPLIGCLLSRTEPRVGTAVVVGAFVAMTGLFSWSLSQAWAGRSLFR